MEAQPRGCSVAVVAVASGCQGKGIMCRTCEPEGEEIFGQRRQCFDRCRVTVRKQLLHVSSARTKSILPHEQSLLQVQIGCGDEENSHESSSANMFVICSDKLRVRTRYRSPCAPYAVAKILTDVSDDEACRVAFNTTRKTSAPLPSYPKRAIESAQIAALCVGLRE